MYLVFLSESGVTGLGANDPNQPHHIHAGLLVHESQYIAMSGEYDALVRRHFGCPAGSPGAPSPLRPGDLYQGAGAFRSWPPERRAELIQDCLSILIRRETPLLVSYISKSEFAAARAADGNALYGHSDPSRLAFSRLLLALTMFLDENVMSQMNPDDIMQSVWNVQDYALLVAGSATPSIPWRWPSFSARRPTRWRRPSTTMCWWPRRQPAWARSWRVSAPTSSAAGCNSPTRRTATLTPCATGVWCRSSTPTSLTRAPYARNAASYLAICRIRAPALRAGII